jgi:hypothetical protein
MARPFCHKGPTPFNHLKCLINLQWNQDCDERRIKRSMGLFAPEITYEGFCRLKDPSQVPYVPSDQACISKTCYWKNDKNHIRCRLARFYQKTLTKARKMASHIDRSWPIPTFPTHAQCARKECYWQRNFHHRQCSKMRKQKITEDLANHQPPRSKIIYWCKYGANALTSNCQRLDCIPHRHLNSTAKKCIVHGIFCMPGCTINEKKAQRKGELKAKARKAQEQPSIQKKQRIHAHPTEEDLDEQPRPCQYRNCYSENGFDHRVCKLAEEHIPTNEQLL